MTANTGDFNVRDTQRPASAPIPPLSRIGGRVMIDPQAVFLAKAWVKSGTIVKRSPTRP